MKVKISLLMVMSNANVSMKDKDFTKILLDEKEEIPSELAYKSTDETLKKICSKYIKIDYGWMVKELADFRISIIDGETVGEAVYITYMPPIDDSIRRGNFLSLEEIYSRNIGVDEFYEHILIGSGRKLFR